MKLLICYESEYGPREIHIPCEKSPEGIVTVKMSEEFLDDVLALCSQHGIEWHKI